VCAAVRTKVYWKGYDAMTPSATPEEPWDLDALPKEDEPMGEQATQEGQGIKIGDTVLRKGRSLQWGIVRGVFAVRPPCGTPPTTPRDGWGARQAANPPGGARVSPHPPQALGPGPGQRRGRRPPPCLAPGQPCLKGGEATR